MQNLILNLGGTTDRVFALSVRLRAFFIESIVNRLSYAYPATGKRGPPLPATLSFVCKNTGRNRKSTDSGKRIPKKEGARRMLPVREQDFFPLIHRRRRSAGSSISAMFFRTRRQRLRYGTGG